MKITTNAALEERLNTYSHGLGILLALIATYILISSASQTEWTLPLLIYGLSIIILFSASTLYHACSDPVLKRKLRIFDHISIYYLIAGTYTPVCLFVLQGSKGTLLLYAVWGIALFGTLLKLFFIGRFEVFSLVLYGLMGWLVVIDLPYLSTVMGEPELFYLGLGGFFYTVGIAFYAIKKIPYNHFIWHVFVLGGACAHWYMMVLLSAPQ
ncbi:MAG: hemolysin III family protein [Flavobacteriaceae bacterium]|nr:hemolysin III family protein [Flavobacteriaceae bacterium]